MKPINGDSCHGALVAAAKGMLSYDSSRDFSQWKEQIEETTQDGICRRIRFCYESENGNFVPALLLIPKQKKYALAITLQGHTTGYHISVGKKKL